MKNVLLLLLAVCLTALASAQKVYFAYLQTEDQSPFYVRMGDKIYSSAASGFLILPNLLDTSYTVNIGFAKSTEPEARFSFAINQNDKGYIIKKMDDGLALFDFKELSLLKANSAPKDNTVYQTKTDAFSSVLSKAANDPSILKVPVGKKEEPKPQEEKKEVVTAKIEEAKQSGKTTPVDSSNVPVEVVKETKLPDNAKPAVTEEKVSVPVAQPDTAKAIVTQPPAEKKEEIAVQEMIYKRSAVSRHSESSTTEGFGVVYYDKAEDKTDTIRILIPASKIILAVDKESAPVDVQPKPERLDSVSSETKSQAVDSSKTSTTIAPVENKAACKSIAAEKDFMKLRKKMAARDTDDAMIDEARKEFKGKCFSVEQVRYLSTLFLTPAAKYQFFDAAYGHVSDKENFASLGAEIKDEYYAKRFKALIGE